MSEGGAGPRPAAVAAAGAADGGHVEMEAEEEAWEEKKARLQRMLRQKLLILAAVYTPIVDEWLKDVADVARRLPFEFWGAAAAPQPCLGAVAGQRRPEASLCTRRA